MRQPPTDHYKILGVSKDATSAQIKSAFRKLALNCHPDRFPGKQGEYIAVKDAYETLFENDKRKKYDGEVMRWSLKEASEPSVPRPPRPAAAYATREGEGGSAGARPAPRPFDDAAQAQAAKIEREIRERNRRAYQVFKDARPQEAPASREQSDTGGAKSIPEQKPTKPKLHTVPATQLGLKVLSEGENVSVDIVAVHGLGAVPEMTWRDSESGVTWLSHQTMLPKAAPDARIMRFGYDSLWLGKTPIRTKLSTIANKLLLVLNRERGEDPERPIIFIGHCFGGLVIERALITAKLVEKSYPGIFAASVGVVFLGTPHRGTGAFGPQSALLAAIAGQSDLHEGLEAGVLDDLMSEQGSLLDVSDDFARICSDKTLLITCFFEQRISNLGKMVGREDIRQFIVDENSASIDGHPSYGLPLDHFKLNKFASAEDGNYRDVVYEITRMHRAARLQMDGRQSRGAGTSYPSPEASADSEYYAVGARQRPSQRSQRDNKEDGRGISDRSRAGPRIGRVPKTMASLENLVADVEANARREAVEELRQDEANKASEIRKEQVEEDLKKKAEEEARAKEEAERQYLDRLRANMRKYGVRNPNAVLRADPLPRDSDLAAQEIREKDRWFRNRVKAGLVEQGIPDGQVDEILHNTGDTMMIDGVLTTYTRMAKKWVSRRTLQRYDVPHMSDPNDPSSVIIKRWVPQYEQEFLWDHSRSLRQGRGRTRDLESRGDPFDHPVYPSGTRTPRRDRSWGSNVSAPSTYEVQERRRRSRTMSGDRRPLDAPRRGSYDEARSPLGSPAASKEFGSTKFWSRPQVK